MAQDWMSAMRQALARTGAAAELKAMLEPAFEAMCQGLRRDA
jgi:hypothetical protein